MIRAALAGEWGEGGERDAKTLAVCHILCQTHLMCVLKIALTVLTGPEAS